VAAGDEEEGAAGEDDDEDEAAAEAGAETDSMEAMEERGMVTVAPLPVLMTMASGRAETSSPTTVVPSVQTTFVGVEEPQAVSSSKAASQHVQRLLIDLASPGLRGRPGHPAARPAVNFENRSSV
jgi:hypothetical protein